MLPLLVLALVAGVAAQTKAFNYTLTPPSTLRPLVAHPRDAPSLPLSAAAAAVVRLVGSDPDPRTPDPAVPWALAIELPSLGGPSSSCQYKRIGLRVGCSRAAAAAGAVVGNFGGLCSAAAGGCRVPLAALAGDAEAGCTPGETFTDCRPWGNLGGPDQTLKIALWASVVAADDGREIDVWALGDRCIADGAVRPTLGRPTCPAAGGVEMAQEFEVKVACSKA